MKKSTLPLIRMEARPQGLTFKAPQSAVDKWDRTIKAKAAPAAEGAIDILGEIGESFWSDTFTTASMVKKQLDAMGKSPVRVTLNSPGGDAFEGIAIYNLLRAHPGNVTVNVIGMAASAGSIIAMAGDRIEIGEAAQLMIHSAWGAVMGNHNDMREFADVLEHLSNSVAELYAGRSGQPVKDVIAMMEKETWMLGPKAVALGFADVAVADDKKAKNFAAPFAQTPAALLAASGDRQGAVVRLSAVPKPGATGSQVNLSIPKGNNMNPTIREQISSFENKRAANAERMSAIMAAAAEKGETLDDAATQEYDGLAGENTKVDAHLVRLKAHEVSMVARATPVAVNEDPAAASALRGGALNSGIISVKANVEPGIAYTRYVKAMVMAKGNPMHAHQIAEANQDWKDTTPQVAKALRMATVTGGDTTTAGWASELVYNQNLASEFIEYLRPKTIIGRIPNLTRVPFNIRIAGASAGTTGYWVGQGAPIPASKMTTTSISMGIAKAGGLVILTKELIMSSQPSAEMMVRDDLAAAIQYFLDQQFIAPDYAAVTNVSPASITNGVIPTAASSTTAAALRTDIQTLFSTWITSNIDPTNAVWVMTGTQALAISMMLNALSQPYFPTMTATGGTLNGYPVIVSQACQQVGSPVAGEGQMIVLINARDILLADEGQVTIDASAEASVQMLDNPTNNAQAGTATTMVSMWQTDSVALRAIRFINWAKRRSNAVAYIKDAAYVS